MATFSCVRADSTSGSVPPIHCTVVSRGEVDHFAPHRCTTLSALRLSRTGVIAASRDVAVII